MILSHFWYYSLELLVYIYICIIFQLSVPLGKIKSWLALLAALLTSSDSGLLSFCFIDKFF